MKKRGPNCDVQYDRILVDQKAPFSVATLKESEDRLITIYEIGWQFLERRELGQLCRAAYETVKELMMAAVENIDIRPGMVAVIQTFA